MSNGWRPHIESALCLDLGTLAGVIVDGTREGTLQWSNGNKVSFRVKTEGDTGTLTLAYTTDGAPVTSRIALVKAKYGFAHRWLFVCPYIGRRALKLYKWHGIPQFCHREAINPRPTYASQRVSGFNRVQHQRMAIRHKLHDTSGPLYPPVKPKWMRWHTFAKLIERDEELEEQVSGYLLAFWRRSRACRNGNGSKNAS